MKSENKTYYLKLKVIAPIHIGCDEVYEPTGFALDEENKELISFEPASFLDKLEQKDLDSYSAICKKGTVPSLLEVYKFIRQHKEHADGRRVTVSDAFVHHYNKTLKIAPSAVQQQLNTFQVGRTAFQRLNATPYIPGSAIKGSIRTAVLNLRSRGKNHLKFRNGKELNDKLSGGTFANDPFRLVKVDDFQAVGGVTQRVVYGVNRKKRPSKKEARGPYQMLEVIEEGSEFVGTITVQQPPPEAGIKQAITFIEIQKALAGFYNREQQKEQLTLQGLGCDITNFSNISPEASLLRIGRHSGAECVTVEGHRDIKIMQGPGQSKYKEYATTLWLAAGSDNPTTNKFLKPFGWAVLSILSEEEIRQLKKERKDSFKTWETDQQQAIIAFKEKIELLTTQRKTEELEKKRLAEKQLKKEEELLKFPWRLILPKLEQISDWGALKTEVLEHEDFKQYQKEEEVGRAVMEVAVQVAEKNRKRWDESRDQLVAEWLVPSAVNWTSHNSSDIATTDNPILVQIRGFKTPADYDRSLGIADLDIESCCVLSPLFKKWNWDKKKKAKANNHALWKNLQSRIKQLKQ